MKRRCRPVGWRADAGVIVKVRIREEREAQLDQMAGTYDSEVEDEIEDCAD